MKFTSSFVAVALALASSIAAVSAAPASSIRREDNGKDKNNAPANKNEQQQKNGNDSKNANGRNNANGSKQGQNNGGKAGNNGQGNNNGQAVGAAYFITNDETGNTIIASAIKSDGKLFAATATPAGGRGLHGIAQGPDGLFSQGAIKVSGDKLFTVNTGSNTLSAFRIDSNNPTKLTRISDPVSSQGEFPVSLAVSPANGNVCVLNGGELNSVACFKPDDQFGLLPVPNTFRELGLDQTTAATGVEGTVSHLLFNEAGNRLMASVKGKGDSQGFVAVWDVNADSELSEQFKAVTPPTGGVLPFGIANHPNNPAALIVADAKIGFDVIDLDASLGAAQNGGEAQENGDAEKGQEQQQANQVEVTKGVIQKRQNGDQNSLTGITSLAVTNNVAAGQSSVNAVDGQQAICWTAFSSKTGAFYLSDIGTNTISEITVDGASLKPTLVKQYQLGSGIATIDEEVATVGNQDFLYVLAANQTSIEVVSLAGLGQGQHLQSFRLQAGMQRAGIQIKTDNVQGMATFVRK